MHRGRNAKHELDEHGFHQELRDEFDDEDFRQFQKYRSAILILIVIFFTATIIVKLF